MNGHETTLFSLFCRNLRILKNQKRPVRFILSRLLKRSGFSHLIKIRRPGYLLRFHPSSVTMTLWVDDDERNADIELIKAILRPGDTYIDVGANIGHLTIEAALIVGPTGSVTAFEAHPRTAGFLRDNILLNNIPNVRVAQAAVGATNGWVSFTDERSDDLNTVVEHGKIEVPLITLDTLLADTSPTLIKIDVEGFEKHVLLGAKSILERTSFVYFEAWDRHFLKYGYNFSDIFDFLTNLNFEIVTLSPFVKKISRETSIPNCVNLLAYRDSSALYNRTGWDLHDL